MDYSWAKPGVKCVCVQGGLQAGRLYYEGTVAPVKGRVYEIEGLHVGSGRAAFYIKDCPNPLRGGFDWGWDAARFRPLITKTQEEDVAMFKSLVTGAPMGVEA